MSKGLMGLIANERGATAVEYGLIAALVSTAGVTAMSTLGASLEELFGFLEDVIEEGCAGGSKCSH